MTTYDPSINPEDQPRMPTPEEEPDTETRWRIANRIPAERLDRVPTPEEEPDIRIRSWIADRIKFKATA